MSETETNATLAAAHATVPDVLSLRELAVIGVIDGATGAAALLRSARGQVARVAVGETAFGARVDAIGDERVILTDRWGQTQTLTLPS